MMVVVAEEAVVVVAAAAAKVELGEGVAVRTAAIQGCLVTPS
jgi:hypothetical protein